MTRATAPIHTCTLHPGPVAGVHAVQMHSARAFGKHWHDGFGFGLMDEGGQVSASGRGQVLTLAGQIITTNPKLALFFRNYSESESFSIRPQNYPFEGVPDPLAAPKKSLY